MVSKPNLVHKRQFVNPKCASATGPPLFSVVSCVILTDSEVQLHQPNCPWLVSSYQPQRLQPPVLSIYSQLSQFIIIALNLIFIIHLIYSLPPPSHY